MKTRIAVGAALLLTLGSAVAGTILYGQAERSSAPIERAFTGGLSATSQATPETIAMWTASTASADLVAPKVPI